MYPSVTIFNKEITTYTILVTIGILVAGFYSVNASKSKHVDDNKTIIILLVGCIGMIIGSHLLYGIINIRLLVSFLTNISKFTGIKMMISNLIQIFGGSVFYGGLIVGILFSYLYMKIKKIDITTYLDVCAPAIPLFHFFGRIGCFLVGCCYGIESKIGFTYTHSMIESANNVNRFPIQLVEATLNLCIFIILATLLKKEKYKGQLLYIYLVLYSFIRFILEFFRGDDYRGFIFNLSTSQFISLILFFFSIIILYKNAKKEHFNQ